MNVGITRFFFRPHLSVPINEIKSTILKYYRLLPPNYLHGVLAIYKAFFEYF